MERATEDMVRAMLCFFALTDREKLRFLPPVDQGATYLLNECGDRTENPLLYYCNAAFELTDRNLGATSEELQVVVLDINSLLAVMIEQSAAYPYVWYLDKRAFPVTGPADRLWNVLRRLAAEALTIQGWVAGPPEIPFAETGWRGVRKKSTDTE